MPSTPAIDPDSPFAGRRQRHLTLVVIDDTQVADDPPDEPESFVGTLDPRITPEVAAADIAIIAGDRRPVLVRLTSKLLSAIAVLGEVVRMARTIPQAMNSSWDRAVSST